MPCFDQPLISAAALLAWCTARPDTLVLDLSFDLADPEAGLRAYQQARLPGARYVHLEHELCGAQTGLNGRHPLPTRAAFAQTVAAWGLRPGTPVVVYDRQGAIFAARAWWMLRWLGHSQVAVLDGGLAAWLEQGGAVASGLPAPTVPADPYPQLEPLMAEVDAAAVHARLEPIAQGEWLLLDARAPERYRGDVEPLDRVPGHIPGARNRFFKLNLDDQGRFLPPDQLRAAFADLLAGRLATDVIHQCGSGVTACHNLLAMSVAGWEGGSLYSGSWSQWCADPTRPVARGPQP